MPHEDYIGKSISIMPDIMKDPQGDRGARDVLIPKHEKQKLPPPDVVGPWKSRRAFIKWCFPCVMVGFGGYIGSAGLHFASYNFVHEMDEWNATIMEFRGEHDTILARDVETRFASNRDPVAKLLGPPQVISMGSLDKIAAVFPAVFVALMMLTRRVELWTKVMVCTALLAASKGIIGAVTTVPDSSGWEICRDAHLQADGYAWMSQNRTFLEIVTVDFWWFPTYGRPLRYCSDMMFSGHTFFVTLYALGLYEVALIWTHSVSPKYVSDVRSDDDKEHNKKFDLHMTELDPFSRKVAGRIKNWKPGAKTFFRASVLFFVSALAIGQQVGEIYYVLLSRFHYTSDVVVALMLTFLFYTNGAISIFAKQWALRDLHFLFAGRLLPTFYFCDEKIVKKWDQSKSFPSLEEDHTHSKMLCCVFSCSGGIENPPYPKIRECARCKDEKGNNLICKDLAKHCRGCGHSLEDSGMKAKSTEHTWISRGDIFVPFCCFPCCCLAGREHVYSDRGIEGFRMLIGSDNDPTNKIGDDVVDHMHMHEGISESDVHEMKEWALGMDGRDSKANKTSGEPGSQQPKISHHFNPWAFRYSHSMSTNFLLDCENRPDEVSDFKNQPARVCHNRACRELMPFSTDYPDDGDWRNWDYKYCIGCGHSLKGAKKMPWGQVKHLDVHDMA